MQTSDNPIPSRENSSSRENTLKHPPTLTSKEIEALYARPNNKQNQIGIPVNNTLDVNKQTIEKSDKADNHQPKSLNMSQSRNTNEASEESKKMSNQNCVPAIKVTSDANNQDGSNKSKLGQDEAMKAEKRKQGETHLLQLRKGAASNKPIFTSIFGSPSSHQSNRYIIYFLLEIISIINLGLSLPYDICYHIF